MTDKSFVEDADAGKFEINPVGGDRLQALVTEVYQTPAEITKKQSRIWRSDAFGALRALLDGRLARPRRE